MFYYPKLVPIFVTECSRSAGTVRTQPGTFKLLPMCCNAHRSRGARGVSVNGVNYYGNIVSLIPGKYMRAEVVDRSTATQNIRYIEYGFIGDYVEREPKNGICWLTVNGNRYWVAGAELVIRSTVASNIRVIGAQGYTRLEIVR